MAKSILLVEDDNDLRANFAEVLELYGYQVYQAENGQVAFDFLLQDKTHVDGIILDLMMPIMDGRLFLEKAKDILERRHIPVLIATAAGRADESFGLSASCRLVRKPLSIDVLIMAVENMLEKMAEPRGFEPLTT